MAAFYATGLIGWTLAIPTIGTMAGIQGGLTAYSKDDVKAWEKTVGTILNTDKINQKFPEKISQTLAHYHRQLMLSNTRLIADAETADTILDIRLLEIGLAEMHDESLREPDENFQRVNVNPKAKTFLYALNFIFDKSPFCLYMLVETTVLRGLDASVIDKRRFGYASSARPFAEWTENNATWFRAEVNAASDSISDEITSQLIFPVFYSADERERD